MDIMEVSVGTKKIQTIYDYRNKDGDLKFQVVRFQPKSFSQRRPVNEKDFAWGLSAGWYEKHKKEGSYYLLKDRPAGPELTSTNGAIWLERIDPILYRLDLITQAISQGEVVFIVEGEKDADNLSAFGYAATTSPMGAGKWNKAYAEDLSKSKNVVIIADKDIAGKKHAESVAEKLSKVGIPSIKIIEMPNNNGTKVKDFTDWHKAGGTKEEFEEIIANTPAWKLPSVDDNLPSQLVDQYGMPYYFGKRGEVISVNESYWAGLHFNENIELYEPNEKEFYRYDEINGLYSEVTGDIIKKEISEKLLCVSRAANIPSLERQRKISVLNNIVAQLRGIAEKKNAFVKDQRIVHLGNGVIVFKESGEADFTKFSPRFLSRNQSPIYYDPKAQCPRFLNELLYPAVQEQDAMLIQKYIGSCLLGDNLIQRFLILDGKAGAGKTTLVSIFQKLVGLTNVTELRTKHLDERFELFRYLKKTLLIGIDVPGNFLSQRGAYVIKGLVGGDIFDSEQKCGTGCFQLIGKYCIIITSNSRLQVKLDGDLGAWRRRLLIVRFESEPPMKKIPNFADLLIREEGSGILNWALQGLAMLLDDIQGYGDIKLESEQKGIVDALLAESDSLKYFLEECVEADECRDLSVQELVEAYAEYCPTKGWHPKPITIIQRELEGLMLQKFHAAKSNSIQRNGKGARGFRRVRLKNEDTEQWD